MTDDAVRTKLRTDAGWVDFQDYFVRQRHAADVLEVRFDGAESARPGGTVLAAIAGADLIVIAPSNPFVSVAPILSVPGMQPALMATPAPVVAVSPIVGGAALRGPADAMLRSLTGETGAAGVARHYARAYPGLIDTFVLDTSDAPSAPGVEAAGMRALTTGTVLADDDDRQRLAAELLGLADPGGGATGAG